MPAMEAEMNYSSKWKWKFVIMPSRPSNETFIAVLVSKMSLVSVYDTFVVQEQTQVHLSHIITLSLRFIRLWLSCYSFNPPCECVYFTVVPAAPSSCNITLSYSQLSGKLLFIDTTWNTVSVSQLCILWSQERAPTLERAPTPYFCFNFLYRVLVYSNECPPWSEFQAANKAYL